MFPHVSFTMDKNIHPRTNFIYTFLIFIIKKFDTSLQSAIA